MNDASRARRSLCAAAAFAAVAALAAACSGLGAPQRIVLTPTDLYRELAKQLPVERRVLGVLRARVEMPRLRFISEEGRLGAEFDVAVADPLRGATYRGVIGFDSALRYEASDASVRLDRVRVQRLQFDGVPASSRPLFQELGGALAEQLLQGLAVHRFSAEQQRRAERLGVAPGAIGVTSEGVTIDLAPPAAAMR